MDPASALGLASAIVAIVDFSWKLLTGAWEIHQSLEGITAENSHLEDVTGRLESLMEALTTDVPIKTTAERNILHLAKECNQDAECLRDLLLTMKVPGRKRSLWTSLSAKWKSILNKREVAQLKIRLQESRADIQVNIISMLKEDQSTICLQLARIEQDCKDLKTGQLTELNGLKAEILTSLSQHDQLITQQKIQDIQQSIATISTRHRILRHLLPDQVSSREDHILQAEPDTCHWILARPATGTLDNDRSEMHVEIYRQEINEYFVHWLRFGKDVLNISGNPGSGKSTLMKYIARNSVTQNHLRAWNANKQLIFAQFYLWTAGTEAQRTLPGLLASLLFQALSQHPDLIEAVFPRQFKFMMMSQSQTDRRVEKFQDFNSKKIEEAFELLLTHVGNSDYKVFFLIDGLDEFDGGDLGHEVLAEKLKSWTTSGDVKLLVSSRPWRPFLTTFTTHRTLHLHELNRTDIRTYAINSLFQDREIHRIGVDRMKKTIEDIVEELSSQAQGIFLWAHLVLDSIRQGIRRQYSANLLKAKIREYPSDLDDLYDALRGPIEKSSIDRALSNRMLLLAAAAPEHFPLYTLAFSWLLEDDKSGLLDPSFPPLTNCQPYSQQELEERLQCVAERMNGLTRGLLERFTTPSMADELRPQVRFCHRTARDYLITNAKRYSSLEECWPGFHQSDPYGRIYLADLIYTRAIDRSSVYLDKPFCRDFKLDTIRKFKEPIQPFASYMFSEHGAHPYYSHHDTARFRFLRYAAICRLDSFVLCEVANYSRGYSLDPHETTILLAQSLHSGLGDPAGDCRLAFELLRVCLDRDMIVEADVRGGQCPVHRNTRLHLWIVTLIFGLEGILQTCSAKVYSLEKDRKVILDPSLPELCCLLNELAVKLGQWLSLTVEVGVLHSRKNGGGASPLVDGTKRTFRAAGLLEWAGCLSPSALGTNNGRVLGTVQTIREQKSPSTSLYFWMASWNLASTSGSTDGTIGFTRNDLLRFFG